MNVNHAQKQPYPSQEQTECCASLRQGMVSGVDVDKDAPCGVNASAFFNTPAADKMRSPHSSGSFHFLMIGARPQATVESRLEDWVLSAPSEAQRQARRKVGEKIRNAQTQIQEDGCLVVNEDLCRFDIPDLCALPDNLTVSGNLDLSGCTGLTVLPDCLTVDKHLDLSGCTGLSALPDNLMVGKSLYLRGCASLNALPDTITVGENLVLSGCTGLSVLPENLSVHKHLDLYGCVGLRALPDSVKVGENLSLRGCTSLGALPDNLIVGKNIDLSGCVGLSALPENLRVGGHLNLSGCLGLSVLPDNLTVGEDLSLHGCTSLSALPDNLTVGRNLGLSECTGLSALPESLKVGGFLDLSKCTGLNALPEHLTVSENLYLSGCTGLNALPEHLTVSKHLYLSGCTGLSVLPEHLTVGENLYLQGCTALSALPERLGARVGGYFDLSDCIGLNALPNWVATLGRACNGSIRCITLSGCGLSETVLNRLREQNNPNVQFIFGHAAQQHQEFVSFTDALNSWVPEEMHTDLLYHDWQLSAGQEAQLMTFLSRLHQTAEAQNRTTKPSLQYRVQSFLSQMKDNRDDYRALALERISQGLESCDDGVILIMNDIEKLTRIRQASLSENPEAALRELGQSLLALDVVQRHAAAKCARSLFVDPVEVYLALEIRLADELNLPVSTRHMLFERCANLTERDIEAAKQEALSVISNPQNTQNYLERWAPWKRYQRLQQIAHLSWDQLPTSHKSFELNEVCAISGARLDALQDPICVGQTLYSLKSFLTWWGEHGTDPVTRLNVGISNIHALHVTPATLHKSAYSDLRDSGNG